jgi:hypothetical protein
MAARPRPAGAMAGARGGGGGEDDGARPSGQNFRSRRFFRATGKRNGSETAVACSASQSVRCWFAVPSRDRAPPRAPGGPDAGGDRTPRDVSGRVHVSPHRSAGPCVHRRHAAPRALSTPTLRPSPFGLCGRSTPRRVRSSQVEREAKSRQPSPAAPARPRSGRPGSARRRHSRPRRPVARASTDDVRTQIPSASRLSAASYALEGTGVGARSAGNRRVSVLRSASKLPRCDSRLSMSRSICSFCWHIAL